MNGQSVAFVRLLLERGRPAGEGGPPPTLSYLEMKQFEPIGLRPGGKILPPLRLDDPPSDPKTITSQAPSVEEPADQCNNLPIHTGGCA